MSDIDDQDAEQLVAFWRHNLARGDDFARSAARTVLHNSLMQERRAERAEQDVKRLREALQFVLGSSLLSSDTHDWQTCHNFSCQKAREALVATAPRKEGEGNG